MTRLPKTLPAFFWHFLKKQPLPFTLFFLAPITVVIDSNLIPYILKLVVDAITDPMVNRATIFQRIGPVLWAGGAAWLGFIVIIRVQHYWQAFVIPRFQAQIRMSTLEHLTAHSHRYFANHMSGSLSNKVADLPKALDTISNILRWNCISTFAVVVAALALLATVDMMFVWILGVWVMIHLTLAIYFAKKVYRASEENAEDKSALSGGIVDTVSNAISMQLFARRAYELSYIGQKQATEARSNKRLILSMSNLNLSMDIPYITMLGGMFYFLITQWQQGAISTGDVVFVFNTCWAVTFNMWFLGSALADLFREIGVARQALRIINTPHEIVDSANATPLKANAGAITFEQVSFHYDNGHSLFENKNVVIESGQKVGLVGFSGSGKTTFVNLILRLFDVEAGRILIDGQDIAQVTQDSLHENIAMIPQDTSLFHRSLMDNIRYGRLDATDDEVIDASRRAHCHDFISRLPEGYDTLVGERGIKLSGGQRQRIAIARALLKNAPILILDEATSALDSMTEKHIQTDLHNVMAGRTVIAIAHRLSTLSEMDRILVFDKGHIIEDGSHQQLLDAEGHYAKMWRMQAGGFLPESEG